MSFVTIYEFWLYYYSNNFSQDNQPRSLLTNFTSVFIVSCVVRLFKLFYISRGPHSDLLVQFIRCFTYLFCFRGFSNEKILT